MSEPTTVAGRAFADRWKLGSAHGAMQEHVAAIEAEAAAAARAALLDELEEAVKGLEPTGDPGYYDDRWVLRAAVLAEINRRRP